ncbi:DgyrCDS14484 [Dimorphilus gyrociliatus]|uniref:DgyrCDS14484 n=1 Tax=Dimorphilus gyrociliatus TaxID=2664684 RepID=A0A7I8WDR5_9ANNE|nr:DgyrCDS14484 [Dimorphilus gyrociliatus]
MLEGNLHCLRFISTEGKELAVSVQVEKLNEELETKSTYCHRNSEVTVEKTAFNDLMLQNMACSIDLNYNVTNRKLHIIKVARNILKVIKIAVSLGGLNRGSLPGSREKCRTVTSNLDPNAQLCYQCNSLVSRNCLDEFKGPVYGVEFCVGVACFKKKIKVDNGVYEIHREIRVTGKSIPIRGECLTMTKENGCC